MQSVNLVTTGRIAGRNVTVMVTCVIPKMESACVILVGRKLTAVEVSRYPLLFTRTYLNINVAKGNDCLEDFLSTVDKVKY